MVGAAWMAAHTSRFASGRPVFAPAILYGCLLYTSIRAPRRATLFMPRAARAYAFAGESDFWHVGAAFFIMAGSRLYKRALVFSTALERG